MDSKRARNVSFNGEPVEFLLAAPHVIVFDPLALDVLVDYPREDSPSPDGPSRAHSQQLHETCFAGFYKIASFRAGRYRFDLQGMERGDDEPRTGVEALKQFSIDSAAFIIADYSHLGDLTACFDWDKYDLALQAPVGDDSIFLAVNESLGGEYYAVVVSPGVGRGSVFEGDGTYILRERAIQRVDPA